MTHEVAAARSVAGAGGRRPTLLMRLREDVEAIRRQDPSCASVAEALLLPGLHAICLHRLAHRQYRRGRRLRARLLASCSRILTGVDLHPGANLGRRVFIDHATGVVIGETAVVEDDVLLFQQVTLGSIGPRGSMSRHRRHPVLRRGVVVGVGAAVLGPVEVGAGAFVGAHAVVLVDVPPGARVPACAVWRGG